MEAVEKEDKLQLIYSKIFHVVSFLVPYLPLANAHNSDFILFRHWETLIPASFAEELLSLDNQQLCLLPSGKLFTAGGVPAESVASVASKTLAKDLADNSELVSSQKLETSDHTELQQHICDRNEQRDFQDNWPKVVLVEKEPSLAIFPNENDEKSSQSNVWDRTLVPTWTHNSLMEFVLAAKSRSLPDLNVLTSLNELRACLKLQSDAKHLVITSFMNTKKSYEVDIMTALCAELAKRYSLTNVSTMIQMIFYDVTLSYFCGI
jgi:hypothetical protein